MQRPLVCASCGGPFPKEGLDQACTCTFCGMVNAPPLVVITKTVERIVDVCADHGTWFDRTELDLFVGAHSTARVGEVTAEDLQAVGVGGTSSKDDVGFFGAMFDVTGLFGR